jgi:DNA-binding transcriptional LysR family regulator
MELRHLRYFVAVSEELHFARAAERLRITPPSLTQQIQALETELGVRLLNRTKRSVALTEAGRNFLDEARKTLRQAEKTELVGRQAGRGDLGRIEIGYMTSSACSGIVARSIAKFHHQHPLVDIHLQKLETPEQLRLLAERRIDLGFIRPPDRYPLGLVGVPVFRQRVVIALPARHRLAKSRQLKCTDLAKEVFIAPSVEAELAFRGYVAAIAEQGGFEPIVAGRAPDYLTILTLVSAGLGLAAVPESFTRFQIPGVEYRAVDLEKEALISLAYRRDDRAPAILSFVTSVKQTLGKSE